MQQENDTALASDALGALRPSVTVGAFEAFRAGHAGHALGPSGTRWALGPREADWSVGTLLKQHSMLTLGRYSISSSPSKASHTYLPFLRVLTTQ